MQKPLTRLRGVLPVPSAGVILPTSEVVGSHDCPVRVVEGIGYCLVPQLALRGLRESRDTLAWLAIGAGLVAVAAIVAVYLRPPQVFEKPVYIEKPVILEKEKAVPVDRGCLAFCGNR